MSDEKHVEKTRIELVYPRLGERIDCKETHNSFVIGEMIGEGNFSKVYSAIDVWGNDVAVKVLKPKGTYEAVREACVKEIVNLKRLRHPNITYLHDAFEYRNAFYIVTEKCSSTLSEILKIRNFDGRLWLRPIAHCLLQAVSFVHREGYLHQDIHSGNVFSTFVKDELLPQDRSALTFKLGDVGISRMISEVTAESTMANWMRPPEVIAQNRFGNPDHRIDIYHLGLLFLQILLGGDIRFTDKEIVEGRPARIAKSLNIKEGNAIAKALQCNVQDRYGSAMEFWTAIQ